MVNTTGEIRRRRECLKCHKRFTTYERICQQELIVIKRDGSRQPFDAYKIRVGLEKALEKRPAIANIDTIVAKIEKKVKVREKKEVESKFIGQAILNELKKVDIVAYLRFVSVYRQFEQPSDFKKELDNLTLKITT